MVAFAHALPDLRARVEADLGDCDALGRSCVLAAAVRLLEIGFFRVGSEEYAAENASYGLATMRKEHVTIEDDGLMVFDYPAKSGQRRHQGIADEQLARIVAALRRRRSGGPELLAYKADGRWRDVRSEDINEYLKDATGGVTPGEGLPHLNATALAAVALAVSGASATTTTARKRAINRAVKEVAGYLGNTPAVCRASYIDPRVFDAFDAGLTIRPGGLERWPQAVEPGELPIHQPELEAAVLDLIDERASSAAIEPGWPPSVARAGAASMGRP